MKTLIAINTIHRALTLGTPGDKNKGTAAVPPKVQEIRPGQYFTAKDTTEEDDLIARGAARVVKSEDTKAKVVLSANVDEANEQARLAAEQAKQEAEAQARKNAEREEAARAQREQERIDAENKARQEEENKKQAEAAAAAKASEAAAKKKAAEAEAAKKTTASGSKKKTGDSDADDLV